MTFGGGGTSPITDHVHDNNPGEGGQLSKTLTLMGPDILFSLITDNTAQVNANTANISTNASSIATNATDIGTNTAAIAAIPSPAWNRIVNETKPGGSGNFDVTGLTSTSKYLMFTFAGSFGGADKLRLRLGTGGSIDTGNNYSWRSGRNGSYSGAGSTNTIEIMTSNSGGGNNFFVSGLTNIRFYSGGGNDIRGTLCIYESQD